MVRYDLKECWTGFYGQNYVKNFQCSLGLEPARSHGSLYRGVLLANIKAIIWYPAHGQPTQGMKLPSYALWATCYPATIQLTLP